MNNQYTNEEKASIQYSFGYFLLTIELTPKSQKFNDSHLFDP